MKNVYQQSILTHDKQQYKCVSEIEFFLLPVMIFIEHQHQFQTNITKITMNNSNIYGNTLLFPLSFHFQPISYQNKLHIDQAMQIFCVMEKNYGLL